MPVQAQEMKLEGCPEVVQNRIRAEARDGRVIEVEKETGKDSAVVFEAEVINGAAVYDVAVSENGLLLAKVFERMVADQKDDEDLGAEEGDDEGDDEDDDEGDYEGDEQETPVTMEQLPEAVRATLMLESKHGEIEELEMEVDDGEVTYSAEVEFETDLGELTYEVEIAANGMLIEKVLESMEVDEDDDGDDDEDEGDDDEDEDDDDDDDDGGLNR
jgi:hypothetical protein